VGIDALDASNAGERLHLPEETRGDRGLKPGAFGIRHPVIQRPSSGCHHGPGPVTAGSSGAIPGLSLMGGWAVGLQGSAKGGSSRQTMRTAGDMTSHTSLMLLPHSNIPQPFSL